MRVSSKDLWFVCFIIFLDGTGELLDAWLMLIEKMVNPKTVLESPHQLPAKSGHPGFQSFDPVPYLIRMQKVTMFYDKIEYL